MRHWHQDLNIPKRKQFHFRGTFHSDTHHKLYLKYELSSGRALRFIFERCEDYAGCLSISLGLIFFTMYLSFPFPNFLLKFIKGESGFYLYDWALVAFWKKERWSGSSQIYFHIDDFFLGKVYSVKGRDISVNDVWFKLGDHEFKMDKITWEVTKYFRSHIPFSLYHRTRKYLNMEIAKPPMRSGKGENSWDCGDDGTFGLSSPWEHEIPTYFNDELIKAAKLAVEQYVEHVLKDCDRYGGSSGPRGVDGDSSFEFIGKELTESGCATGLFSLRSRYSEFAKKLNLELFETNNDIHRSKLLNDMVVTKPVKDGEASDPERIHAVYKPPTLSVRKVYEGTPELYHD